MGDSNANPAQHLENANWLKTALAILSPEQRAVIELTFYHGLAYQEIAKILNCPENTVKTRMCVSICRSHCSSDCVLGVEAT